MDLVAVPLRPDEAPTDFRMSALPPQGAAVDAQQSTPSPLEYATEVTPGSFQPEAHWYPKAYSATIHPMVAWFMSLSTQQIVERYCHLNPRVRRRHLAEVLAYQPRFYRWAGADLLHVTTEKGHRNMVVIENNSCPSGQKSMPLLNDLDEQGGYHKLMAQTFKPMLSGKRLPKGVLAVISDKNPMEVSGYAAAMADVFGQPVYWAQFHANQSDPPVRINNEVLEVRTSDGQWHPVRAAFRYLTQQPWDRLSMHCKTAILNPIIACLAGGRNKTMADKSYSFYNSELVELGLKINTPETVWDVQKNEIPFWVKKLGGRAVVKVPYSNAGQGVYTIVNKAELDAFMALEFHYANFIVQSLIGNYHCSSTGISGRYFHVGTVPNRKGNSYALDFRMMVHATRQGFRPLALYSRRAALPLARELQKGSQSWDMLGTNLSIKLEEGGWDSDVSRLLLMERKGFNQLGIGVDDMIEGYIQTVLSTIAIDKMAQSLVNAKGAFRMKLFRSLNADDVLLNEILLK